ncbi:aldehyde dehydrogenase family protein [Bradyrhizobium sp. U531]|uniref:aldehyde dehydrogenase family protein n=1 Tax=Bradyrhizobium sp. U531 TaxID=3053458 RepID=UPI003F41C179
MAFALRIANDFPFGLAAAIRTRDVARAHRVAPSSAGVVWVNDHHRCSTPPRLGGPRLFRHRPRIRTETFDNHFNTKSVMIATHEQPFDWYRDTANQKRLNSVAPGANCVCHAHSLRPKPMRLSPKRPH